MKRLRVGCLALAAALLCAGCIVNATPVPPTAALVTATSPATTNSPASPTALVITTPTPSETAPPTVASATPIASATNAANAAATATDTPVPTASSTPALPPVPTRRPQATALPVGIISFSITPQQINPGDSVTLTWQATGQQAAIYRLEPGGPLTDMYNVPLSGTLTLKTPAGLRNQVDYVLYAGAGDSTASATVSAIITCPDKWFFAKPPAACPGGPGNLVAMASEAFEHGLTLWLSSQDRIYILFGDANSPNWSAVANQWSQGQPESDPSLTPPAGLFQPVRGFGVAWRSSDLYGGQTLRDRLGWATEPESALTGGYQCDSARKYNHCYISGPGGVVYHLKPEFSGWEVWQGPS